VSDPPPDRRPEVLPTPAATVVPIKDGESGVEVLLLRRNSRGQFGGMWVFPGGQVDPADLLHGPGQSDQEAELAAARRAAVREAREEAALELDQESLVALSFWVPPPESPRRFATWFFLASPAPDSPEIVVDRDEIHDHRWINPAQALQARDRGEIDLAPPTYMTLWWLAQRPSVHDAVTGAAEGPPARFESHVGSTNQGVVVTFWAGDAGYEDGDLDRPGPRRRLVLDPAGWRVEIGS
jgi:8-oxo-dGTP pyrophosphatase MutT (NUDIX family)